MYGVLLCDAGVVALASQGDQPRLHPSDLLLLATFLRANDSLRQVGSASFLRCILLCFGLCHGPLSSISLQLPLAALAIQLQLPVIVAYAG